MKELENLARSLHENDKNEDRPVSILLPSYGRSVLTKENNSTGHAQFTPDEDPDSISAEEKENFILSLFQEYNGVQYREAYGPTDILKRVEKALGTSFQYLGMEKSESYYSFCEIDTQFVETFRNLFPIPEPKDYLSFLSTLSYEEIYNRKYGIKNNLQSYASSFYILMQSEEEFRRIAQKWINLQVAEGFVEEYCLADEARSYGYHVKSELIQTLQTTEVDSDSLSVYQIDFWIRRMIDGSAFSLWALLYDVMEKYDRHWLETLLNTNPPLKERLSPHGGRLLENLNIRESPSLTAPILGKVNAGTVVRIIARGDKKTEIDGLLDYWLLVDTKDFRGWAYGGYVAVTDEMDKEGLCTFYYHIEDNDTEQLSLNMNEVLDENQEIQTNNEIREEGVLRGLTYKLTEDGYLVSGHTQSLPQNVFIEPEIEDVKVTQISQGAFGYEKKDEIVTINIPSSIEIIYGNPFYKCSRLESIEVEPDNEHYISDKGVLYNKEKTELIAYPGGRKNSFYTIPNGIVSIGENAFAGSQYLKEIRFPITVSHIGDFSFEHSGLTEISIPSSIKIIERWTFYGCVDLKKVILPENLFSIKNYAFYGCQKLEEIQIPQGVQIIGHNTFTDCLNLREITIPDSVIVMGDWAFGRCEALTINCEIQSMPESWSYYWNKSDEKGKGLPVNWGWKEFD